MVAGGSGVRLGASADQVVEHYAAAPEVYTRAGSLPMTEFAIDALAAAQAVIPARRDRLFRGCRGGVPAKDLLEFVPSETG